MKTVGLTGGIGSGKSLVCKLFAEHGIPIIDTDQIAREVVQPNSLGLQAIAKQLGCEFITDSGELNRSALRQAIFTDPIKKQTLESILHPLIRQSMLQQITVLKQSPNPSFAFIVVAIPLLVEGIKDNQKPDYLDEIWVVDCSQDQQLERAASRDQQKREQIEAIIRQQATREERLHWADRVISNQAGLPELEQQIKQILITFNPQHTA
ncbi:MAG: dephospho-CoA kinase [Thiotrichales bacterium]|nr:dephospho-CoA kinase [Thiotrichales bacterium]